MEDLRKKFEEWADKHKFLLNRDKEMNIYSNVYTEGAWMAYQQGFEQGKVNE